MVDSGAGTAGSATTMVSVAGCSKPLRCAWRLRLHLNTAASAKPSSRAAPMHVAAMRVFVEMNDELVTGSLGLVTADAQ